MSFYTRCVAYPEPRVTSGSYLSEALSLANELPSSMLLREDKQTEAGRFPPISALITLAESRNITEPGTLYKIIANKILAMLPLQVRTLPDQFSNAKLSEVITGKVLTSGQISSLSSFLKKFPDNISGKSVVIFLPEQCLVFSQHQSTVGYEYEKEFGERVTVAWRQTLRKALSPLLIQAVTPLEARVNLIKALISIEPDESFRKHTADIMSEALNEWQIYTQTCRSKGEAYLGEILESISLEKVLQAEEASEQIIQKILDERFSEQTLIDVVFLSVLEKKTPLPATYLVADVNWECASIGDVTKGTVRETTLKFSQEIKEKMVLAQNLFLEADIRLNDLLVETFRRLFQHTNTTGLMPKSVKPFRSVDGEDIRAVLACPTPGNLILREMSTGRYLTPKEVLRVLKLLVEVPSFLDSSKQFHGFFVCLPTKVCFYSEKYQLIEALPYNEKSAKEIGELFQVSLRHLVDTSAKVVTREKIMEQIKQKAFEQASSCNFKTVRDTLVECLRDKLHVIVENASVKTMLLVQEFLQKSGIMPGIFGKIKVVPYINPGQERPHSLIRFTGSSLILTRTLLDNLNNQETVNRAVQEIVLDIWIDRVSVADKHFFASGYGVSSSTSLIVDIPKRVDDYEFLENGKKYFTQLFVRYYTADNQAILDDKGLPRLRQIMDTFNG